MAKVKFVGDQPVTVPELGGRLIEPGQIVEVPDVEAHRFTDSAIWDPADAKTQKSTNDAQEG